MTDTDSNKIMQKIKSDVEGKYKNGNFIKDVDRARRLASKYKKLSEDSTDSLYSNAFIKYKIAVPFSKKKSVVSKYSDMFLRKLYYVFLAMIKPVLITQEKFNQIVVEEIENIKERVSIPSKTASFMEEYSKSIRKQIAITHEDLMKFRDSFQNQKYVCIVGNNLANLNVDSLLSCGISKLFVNDPVKEDCDISITNNYEINNLNEIDFLESRYKNEFDCIIIANCLEYVVDNAAFSHFFVLLDKVLKDEGKLVLRLEKVKEKNRYSSFKRTTDLELVKFILSRIKVDRHLEVDEIIDSNKQDYFVIYATKKKSDHVDNS